MGTPFASLSKVKLKLVLKAEWSAQRWQAGGEAAVSEVPCAEGVVAGAAAPDRSQQAHREEDLRWWETELQGIAGHRHIGWADSTAAQAGNIAASGVLVGRQETADCLHGLHGGRARASEQRRASPYPHVL